MRATMTLMSLAFGLVLMTSACPRAEPTSPCAIEIAGTQLALEGRQLHVRTLDTGGHEILDVELPNADSLQFVQLPQTNIVQVERFEDGWILLAVTSRLDNADAPKGLGCDTRLRAIVVAEDGQVRIGSETARSASCPPSARDRSEFLFLAREREDR